MSNHARTERLALCETFLQTGPDAPTLCEGWTTSDLAAFTSGTLIVDVSCDEGMGFSWARPTTFDDPSFVVGGNVTYYAVDHSPSYLWNSATWEISEALLPHIETLLAGPAAWNRTPTISRAVEIRDGVVLNPKILSFQHRDEGYPHPVRTDQLGALTSHSAGVTGFS